LNSPFATGTFSIVLIFLNHYVLTKENFKLDEKDGDQSHDPLFSRTILHFSSFLILLVNTIFASRALLISLKLWVNMPKFSIIFNFLTFQRDFISNSIGIFLFFFGFALRIYSIKTLGKLFTFEVGLRKDHKLIKTGPYSMIRHPSYLGYIIMSIGLYTFLGTFFGIFISLIICLILYLKRIPIEEHILKNKFGKDFEEYKSKTYKILPYIY